MAVTIIQESTSAYAAAYKTSNTQQSAGSQNPTGTNGTVGTETNAQQNQPAAIVNISSQAREAANTNQAETAGATGAAQNTVQSDQNVNGQNQQYPKGIWESFSKSVQGL
ncbi:MAG: hypothetical protein H7843_01110 [Nitrospirota bacterium]